MDFNQIITMKDDDLRMGSRYFMTKKNRIKKV